MITPLPDTTTSEIATKLMEAQEHYTLTTSRVLTLIVVADANDNIDEILDSVRDASHEHPSRVLVVVSGDPDAETSLDGELRVGGEAGASEMVIMHLKGALASQTKAVVTPLLLPDTPIVAWWPGSCPPVPSEHPIGSLAQRRITNIGVDNSAGDVTAETCYRRLQTLSNGYAPGDTDMTWASLTLWRAIVASAFDRQPESAVEAVEIQGPAGDPAVDLAAAWLVARLAVPVRRTVSSPDAKGTFSVRKLAIFLRNSDITVETVSDTAVRVDFPGAPESQVALSVRSQAEILSEGLRYIQPDRVFAQALRALDRVSYA
ncbi:oxppcycle protein OpcA [Corynebacterium phocae]|uniref:Oxppcycle protein OpcA n=1 Tax=Corynebacterium phocae TaxID=161895 RepID=A0A1L7D2Z3_9CORY|nr:glucose-6-phosphate dehydrogenase assembly protein OpcA [Corynebacterium phocae]APT92488.1 oxppcycle protein OpcA [Corynebacterium phocae]KAA8725091.1 glucose-6-phosphate dehydrogenase assembly protein OpcA [Corynebacterium phocae]